MEAALQELPQRFDVEALGCPAREEVFEDVMFPRRLWRAPVLPELSRLLACKGK